jgi:hypothetical protein
MPDDQVTIDPEFQPPLPDDGQRRWLRLIGIVGLVVGAFIFGWLLRSPSPTEPGPTEVAAPSTTALTDEPRETSTTTTTSTAPAVVGLPVPLSEAVPGLTDSITIWATAGQGYQILRWRPSQPTAEPLALFEDDEPYSFELDVSGDWWALLDSDGTLSVERPTGGDTDSEWSPLGVEAVAVRVGSAAWHDSEPGLLAWLTCPRASTGSTTLYTFDALDVAAEPVVIRAFDRACEADSGVWLRDWGRWGFLIGMDDGAGDPPIDVLLGLDGDEIARSDQSHRVSFIVGNPDGTTTWIDETDNGWFVLSADGQRRSPLPDLGDGERVEGARWSPDGTLLALRYGRSLFGPLGRIVEAATGEVIAEPAASGQDIGVTAWSTDSRFYLHMLGTDLVFLDTVTTASVAVPLPGLVLAVRPHDPAPPSASGTISISVENWSGAEGYELLAGVWDGSDIVGGALGIRINADPFSGSDVVHPPDWSSDDSAEPDDETRRWFVNDYRWDETARLQPGTYRVEFWANPDELKPYGSMIPTGAQRTCSVDVEVNAGEATVVVISDIPGGTGPCP